MGKIRRGGFVFITWKGDHSPRHVHVFRDSRLILKWNLEAGRTLWGKPDRRLLKLIDDLVAEGKL